MSDLKRSDITFEQSEGLEPLPAQMALKTLTNPLRAELLSLVFRYLDGATEYDILDNPTVIGGVWEELLRGYWMSKGQFPDKISYRPSHVRESISKLFREGSYAQVLGFLEHCVRKYPDDYYGRAFEERISSILEVHRCPYRMIDRSVMLIVSDEERDSVVAAMAALDNRGFQGAKAHLQKAGGALTNGQNADSIRESIHAVESVARTLTGMSSLKDALSQLHQRHTLHPALREGLNKLYGYTSDENGIRHSMIGADVSNVGEAEAVFMFGACASFITYLIRLSE